MSFQVNADLVPLFRGLVTGLQPFAMAQDVQLQFESSVDNLHATYNPEEALSEITTLLSRIITFTPQSYDVTVSLERCTQDVYRCILKIRNTGVDLSKLGELLSAIKNGMVVKRLEKGTCFVVSIPTRKVTTRVKDPNQNGTLLPKKYPMYHAAVNKRLSSYFSKTSNLVEKAEREDTSESVFLKKVNAVISSRISDTDFKVDALAGAMALSRTQLFRKVKNLTQMSPQQYLRFVRLEKAKKLLQSKDVDLNVSEVGYAVGFASKSHFTRSFQKEFGFNPSEYK